MVRSLLAGTLAGLLTFAAVPAFADASGDVRGAMIKLANLSSYEITTGGARAVTVDMAKPNAMRMVGMGGMEMVTVGGKSYVKQGPGAKWMVVAGGLGAGDFTARLHALTANANRISATDLGMKSVDGQMLHAYRVTTDGNRGTLYVGADGLPRRMDGDRETGAIRFSRFNAVPPIRPPV